MDTNNKIISYFLLLVGFFPLSHYVHAQATLQQCAGVADDKARLACFDQLARVSAAVPESEKPAGTNVAAIDQADRKVTEALHNRSTGWSITFDDGQVWKQVGTASFVVRVGDACAITPGPTANSLLQCGNRARRIQVRLADQE